MDRRLDLFLWNEIFKYLDSKSQINLTLTSLYLNRLRYNVTHFVYEQKMKSNFFDIYPNITTLKSFYISNGEQLKNLRSLTSLDCSFSDIFNVNCLTNLTSLNCKYCLHIGSINNLTNLISLNYRGCRSSITHGVEKLTKLKSIKDGRFQYQDNNIQVVIHN